MYEKCLVYYEMHLKPYLKEIELYTDKIDFKSIERYHRIDKKSITKIVSKYGTVKAVFYKK